MIHSVKILHILFLISGLLLFSCGDDKTTSNNDQTGDSLLPHHMIVDLSPYGFLATIQIPDTTIGLPELNETNWGALEIRVGRNYGISIQSGEGNMELLKKDLKEDLVFTNEIIAETPNSIIYKKTIKNTDIKPLYHFFYFDTIDGYIVEIKSLELEEYTLKDVEKMLESAKTLREKKRISENKPLQQ